MSNSSRARCLTSSRTGPETNIPLPDTLSTHKYDWTYTSTYCGTTFPLQCSAKFVPADPDRPDHTIPFAELSRRDPIEYFAEIPLFEDELHDNGVSQFNVRIVSRTKSLATRHSYYTRVESYADLSIYTLALLAARGQRPISSLRYPNLSFL